jgi:5-formyltetrahydrofolate cyclo-ligase
MQDQNTIRKHIQTLRQSLSTEQQRQYSHEICTQVLQSKLLETAKHIAIYLPVKGEADPTLLLKLNEFANKQFYLPVLSSTKENHLAFAKYDATTVMKLNRFKIPEPDVKHNELLEDLTTLDCVITPLVGVDNAGNRIGMGGGFYDRTFAFKKTSKTKPLLIGFCYDLQLIAPQTPQNWDVPVDAIVSQSSFKLL